jgi:hypothetical protein
MLIFVARTQCVAAILHFCAFARFPLAVVCVPTCLHVRLAAGWALPCDRRVFMMAALCVLRSFHRTVAAGMTWTSRTLAAPWAARGTHTSVIDAAGAIYVIGGFSGGFLQDVWVSTDGGARLDKVRGAPRGHWKGSQGYRTGTAHVLQDYWRGRPGRAQGDTTGDKQRVLAGYFWGYRWGHCWAFSVEYSPMLAVLTGQSRGDGAALVEVSLRSRQDLASGSSSG